MKRALGDPVQYQFFMPTTVVEDDKEAAAWTFRGSVSSMVREFADAVVGAGVRWPRSILPFLMFHEGEWMDEFSEHSADG